jgi:type I site-specific restriction endonuclease
MNRDHPPTSRRLGQVSSSIVNDNGHAGDHDYLAREAKARIEIDKQLGEAGWSVQSQDKLNLAAGPGVAVREFTLEKPHGRVDYLLFLNGQPASQAS